MAATTRDVANEVADRASAVAARLPDAAASTRSAVEEATRRMESGSDEALAVGTSLTVGLAIGLLIGGANRLLVVLALIPATAMGFTLLDRYAGGGRRADDAQELNRVRIDRGPGGSIALPPFPCPKPGRRRAERPEEGAPGVREDRGG